MLSRPARPFYEQILLGTDEENFIRNISLPPTFKHTRHAPTHVDFWNKNKKRDKLGTPSASTCVRVIIDDGDCCVRWMRGRQLDPTGDEPMHAPPLKRAV